MKVTTTNTHEVKIADLAKALEESPKDFADLMLAFFDKPRLSIGEKNSKLIDDVAKEMAEEIGCGRLDVLKLILDRTAYYQEVARRSKVQAGG